MYCLSVLVPTVFTDLSVVSKLINILLRMVRVAYNRSRGISLLYFDVDSYMIVMFFILLTLILNCVSFHVVSETLVMFLSSVRSKLNE